jgi:hypothetical protein
MLKLLVLFAAAGLALAGPKIGVRAGYYGTNNPFTGQETNGPALGGQLVLPLAGPFDLEFSGTYASSKADIIMSDFLVGLREGSRLGRFFQQSRRTSSIPSVGVWMVRPGRL